VPRSWLRQIGASKVQLIGKHVDPSNVEDRIARKRPTKMEFMFQVTLLASIRVKAETQAEAELKLRTALEASEANLGMLDDTPIVVPVEIEGELDLIEAMENTGEE
jgi:phenylacetate-coenzyme A ligase PaaK-like adenylate-forming protein